MIYECFGIAFLGLPCASHQVVGILTRSVEEVVLDVSHNRIDTVLEQTFICALAGPEARPGQQAPASPSYFSYLV
jgi:hypothetical protein